MFIVENHLKFNDVKSTNKDSNLFVN